MGHKVDIVHGRQKKANLLLQADRGLAKGSPQAPIAQFRSSATINKTLYLAEGSIDFAPMMIPVNVNKKKYLNNFIRYAVELALS